MSEIEIVGHYRLSDLEIVLCQRDSLARACKRALIDLNAAKLLAQHTLGEPYGIIQTIEIIESALEGYESSVKTGEAR